MVSLGHEKEKHNTNKGIYNKSNINFGSRPDWNKRDTQSLTLFELNTGSYVALFEETSEPCPHFGRLWKLPKTKVVREHARRLQPCFVCIKVL
jgi:hypothetical protein